MKIKVFLFLSLFALANSSNLPKPTGSSNAQPVAPYNRGRLARTPKLTKDQQEAVEKFALAVMKGFSEQSVRNLLGL